VSSYVFAIKLRVAAGDDQMLWSTEHELMADATPTAVWALWANYQRWPEWNREIVSTRLHGPFAAGTKYTLRFRGSMPLRFAIVTLVYEREFTDEGYLPGARMGHRRLILPEGQQVRIRNCVYFIGPLAGVYGAVMGRRLRRNVRDFVEREKHLSERAVAGPAR
jgi:hypothetical protein